jgi:methylthioxylose transferase
MRLRLWLILILQAALVILLAVAVKTERLPLGVRREWQWERLKPTIPIPWGWLALASLGAVAYAVFVGLGLRSLRLRATRWAETPWLAALMAAAVAVQIAIPIGAPDEYDLTKWAYVNYLSGSTGYFKVARDQAAQHPWEFLARYPDWIRSQDSLHIGTHPPGLIVAQCILLRTLDQNPALANFLLDHMPPSLAIGFKQLEGIDGRPIRRSERASLYATALLTLLACAGTVVPLYLLARASLPALAAWAAAALWPLVPSANLFQPGADTTYPFLSTSAWALASWAVRYQQGRDRPAARALFAAAISGVVMAFGMVFTLAFLPVGLITALIVGLNRSVSLRMRAVLILVIGAGYLAFVLGGWLVTGADPFIVWRWNLHHHARFYHEYPRTYALWLWVNPIELVIATGLPTVVWCLAGLFAPRRVPLSVWATLLVLTLANLTGRNMGEVARLWMLFMPPFLIAAGQGLDRLGGGPVTLGLTVALVGAQTLTLQSMIQVVYPV